MGIGARDNPSAPLDLQLAEQRSTKRPPTDVRRPVYRSAGRSHAAVLWTGNLGPRLGFMRPGRDLCRFDDQETNDEPTFNNAGTIARQ
jgi:hypothetical protein